MAQAQQPARYSFFASYQDHHLAFGMVIRKLVTLIPPKMMCLFRLLRDLLWEICNTIVRSSSFAVAQVLGVYHRTFSKAYDGKGCEKRRGEEILSIFSRTRRWVIRIFEIFAPRVPPSRGLQGLKVVISWRTGVLVRSKAHFSYRPRL
jgi:hypothetical protein